MSIYYKAKPANDIVNGCATIQPLGTSPATSDYLKHTAGEIIYASGEGLILFQTLDTRFLIPPSGWNA